MEEERWVLLESVVMELLRMEDEAGVVGARLRVAALRRAGLAVLNVLEPALVTGEKNREEVRERGAAGGGSRRGAGGGADVPDPGGDGCA